jgi:hypothetical protein
MSIIEAQIDETQTNKVYSSTDTPLWQCRHWQQPVHVSFLLTGTNRAGFRLYGIETIVMFSFTRFEKEVACSHRGFATK